MTITVTRFNRYEIYNAQMMSLNMELINETHHSFTVNNYLYGLFDGYLYPELQDTDFLAKNDIAPETISKIQNLLDLINENL